MRQRTLGIAGAALLVAGIAISIGSDVVARYFEPNARPASGHVLLPSGHRDGEHLGRPSGRHPGGTPGNAPGPLNP